MMISPILFFSCEEEGNTIEPAENDFAIYQVKIDSLEDLRTMSDADLYTLELRSQPFINLNDIDFYDSSSNIFYLKYTVFSGELDFAANPVYYVMVVNGERKILLVDWPAYFSSLPQNPMVLTFGYAGDLFAIGESFMSADSAYNKVEKSDITHVLKKAGKLRNGLSIEINSINLQNDAVDISLELKNYDSKSLYIFDPEKLTSPQIQAYFGNINFKFGEKYFFPSANDYELIDLSESFNYNLLLEIGAGQKTTISFKINGFSGLPSGIYDCRYYYNMPVNIKKEFRSVSGGRIWMGTVIASKDDYKLN